MTRYERYKEQLKQLEVKRNALLRNGKLMQANALHQDIKEIEQRIKDAETYENARRPRPLTEQVSEEELHQMGIIPLMIECHLIADMLVEIAYMIVDTCEEHGFTDVEFMPELKDILYRSNRFSSFLTKMSPEIANLLLRNDTLNTSLHRKYQNYIKQRIAPSASKKSDIVS